MTPEQVPLDELPPSPAEGVGSEPAHARWIVLFALVTSLLLSVVALIFDGWRLAAEAVSGFSLVLFVVAISVEPLSRVVPLRATLAAGRERSGLILGFAMAVMVSLFCVVAPAFLGGGHMSLQSVAYSLLTAAILIVMLFIAQPGSATHLGRPVRRTIQRIATAYFWLVFLLQALQRIGGSDGSGVWYGFALLLLAAVPLIRLADAFLPRLRSAAVAEKVA